MTSRQNSHESWHLSDHYGLTKEHSKKFGPIIVRRVSVNCRCCSIRCSNLSALVYISSCKWFVLQCIEKAVAASLSNTTRTSDTHIQVICVHGHIRQRPLPHTSHHIPIYIRHWESNSCMYSFSWNDKCADMSEVTYNVYSWYAHPYTLILYSVSFLANTRLCHVA